MAGIGNETRGNILPVIDINQGSKSPGMTGPDYSFADNVLLPGQVGVRDGDRIQDVVDSVKGAAYYIDMIGFGQSSSGLTRGMPVKPLGVNTFMKTGMQCSNGADMYMYVEGVPKGDALGKRVSDGLRSAGLPGMRGLAPGILEDIKDSLDPAPLLQAVFGSGYPVCRIEEKPVGDQDGNIKNPGTGKFYVDNPETVVRRGNQSFQRRWVLQQNVSQDVWEKAPKTHCPNGIAKSNYENGNCNGKLVNPGAKEGFATQMGTSVALSLATVATMVVLHYAVRKALRT
jgi:hypothetical protein